MSIGAWWRRTAAQLRRHLPGTVALGAGALLWGAGALATPPPALLGLALAAVATLGAVHLGRGARRSRTRPPLEVATGARGSGALHAASLLLTLLFLGGIFATPRMVTVAGAVRPAATGAAATARVLPVSAGTGGAPSVLRVASLNVWHGYPGEGDRESRYLRLRRLLADTDADVVLLQEAWSTRRFGRLVERLGDDLDLGYAYTRANGSLRFLGFEEGLAILSRYPLENARRIALGPRTPPWEMRAALGATVALPGGEALEIWNAHLSHSSRAGRAGQARSLARALAGTEVAILGGDLNAAAPGPEVSALAAADLRPLMSRGIDHLLVSRRLLERFTPARADSADLDGSESGSGGLGPPLSDHPLLTLELHRSLRRRDGAAAVAPRVAVLDGAG